MDKKTNSRDMPYQYRESNEPHRETGDAVDARNNNTNNGRKSEAEPDVERANDIGIGDAGWNDQKLSDYTQSHSGDA